MVNLIPMPNTIEKLKGNISFSNYQLMIEKKYEKAILLFNHELENKLIIDETKPCYDFEFIFNKELANEQYIILMDKEVTHIEASSERGFFYASRTLAQLFNLFSTKKVKKITSLAYYIDDKPRFAYRSFMLDVSRHFFKVDEIKKYINLLSNLKINTFHWHLSDDQGFRIDFKTFPNLKEIASKRNKTKINSQDNDDWDNNSYEGCYAYHEIKEVIKYASEHYVDIVPEIDMPGHTSAIVAAYKELHCFNKQNEVRGDFGVFKEIMCPGKENTYTFAKKLLDELCILFKDSKYIHIGGDEVNHENYEKCEDCQRKMNELNLTDTKMLQSYFSNEMANHITNTTNKKVIMWHDGIYDSTNKNIIMQYWDYKMDEKRINYINEGRKTIYSPCSQFYFNDPYAELPLVRTYNRGIHLTNLNRKAYKNILGMECCIWTEWVDNNSMLEFNTNPRLQAFAEASWTSMVNHDFKDFINRIEDSNDFYKYHNIIKAPKNIYLARGEKYRNHISSLYRKDKKEIEYEIAFKK